MYDEGYENRLQYCNSQNTVSLSYAENCCSNASLGQLNYLLVLSSNCKHFGNMKWKNRTLSYLKYLTKLTRMQDTEYVMGLVKVKPGT